MVPSGFNLATQLALVKVGVGARGRPGRSAHRHTHTPQIGTVPLMIASQDSHKKGQIKPFLQDGRAACMIHSTHHQFICELLGLLTDSPCRSGVSATGRPRRAPASPALDRLHSHSQACPAPSPGQILAFICSCAFASFCEATDAAE